MFLTFPFIDQALAQVCTVCSALRCAQNSCYGLMVAALSDSVACKGQVVPITH
jgi:hypothetical protein